MNLESHPSFIAGRLQICFVLALMATATATHAQDAKSAPYPVMAPLDQYMMAERAAEVSLAKSSAPPAIADDATVLVMGKDGYETVSIGKNGFTCLVERSWMSPFDSPDFWNPKIRGPVCYNPAAVRSILPYTLNRTKLVLSGMTREKMHESIVASVAKKELPAPEVGAMSYMMSKDGYLGDGAGHWHPHLMFHIPTVDAATWGANEPGSPVVYNSSYTDMPEPEVIFFVPVGKWSDGTPAHKM